MYQTIFNHIENIQSWNEQIHSSEIALAGFIYNSDYKINYKIEQPLSLNITILKNAILNNIQLGNDIVLSSGQNANWYFDFLKIHPLSDSVLSVMLPAYTPVGILTGGGLIVGGATNKGYVDVHKGIFYPPTFSGKNITLIDDVFSTGGSFKKARDIIDSYNANNNNGGDYVVKEQKVLLYRTDIEKSKHELGTIESLFISVQTDNQKKPKLIYVGREK